MRKKEPEIPRLSNILFPNFIHAVFVNKKVFNIPTLVNFQSEFIEGGHQNFGPNVIIGIDQKIYE